MRMTISQQLAELQSAYGCGERCGAECRGSCWLREANLAYATGQEDVLLHLLDSHYTSYNERQSPITSRIIGLINTLNPYPDHLRAG